jgi:hypothetical protein
MCHFMREVQAGRVGFKGGPSFLEFSQAMERQAIERYVIEDLGDFWLRWGVFDRSRGLFVGEFHRSRKRALAALFTLRAETLDSEGR